MCENRNIARQLALCDNYHRGGGGGIPEIEGEGQVQQCIPLLRDWETSALIAISVSFFITADCTAGHRRMTDQDVNSSCFACPVRTWNGDLNNGENCIACRPNSDTDGEGKTSAMDCGEYKNIYLFHFMYLLPLKLFIYNCNAVIKTFRF